MFTPMLIASLITWVIAGAPGVAAPLAPVARRRALANTTPITT